MKPHRLLPLLVLVLSAFMLSCDSGQQTVTAPDDLQPQFAKEGFCDDHPTHPKCTGDPGGEPGELITFTGDLEGNQRVEGCCPNAGPYPAYTMTLSSAFPDDIVREDKQLGQIFMNNWGQKGDRGNWERGYKVQFWWGEEGTDSYYFLEINGGVKDYDKGTKILTVTFDQEDMCIWHNGEHGEEDHVNVSFVLTRDPNG